MKKILKFKVLFGCSLLSAFTATATESISLFDSIGYTSSETLSNNTVVDLPFHIKNSKTAITFGTSNSEIMSNFLENKDLEVVEFGCSSNTGISAVFLQNIQESTSGRYNEMVNTMLVKKKTAPDLDLPCVDVEDPLSRFNGIMGAINIVTVANQEKLESNVALDYGFYAQGLLVNTQDSMLAGIEIWGFDKYHQIMNYNFYGENYQITTYEPKTNYQEAIDIYFNVNKDVGIPSFGINGDFFVSDSLVVMNVGSDRTTQLNGILKTKGDSLAYISLFDGLWNINETVAGVNKVTGYQLKSEFNPTVVIAFDEAEEVFYKNRIN